MRYPFYVVLLVLGLKGYNSQVPAGCSNAMWFRDGYCDPVNNVEECNWDGGDCCESTCVPLPGHSQACNSFNCLDPEVTTTTPPSSCSRLDWKADGYCDPVNNVEECEWDGGDCCESTCVPLPGHTQACESFNCLDPDISIPTTEAPAPTNSEGCSNQAWHADGYCDPVNNVEECNWDGGDCCESTCVPLPGHDQACNTFNCLDPDETTTTPSTGSCVTPAWQADGYCDPVNNVEECDWDGGDCCESTCTPLPGHANACGSDSFNCLDPAVSSTSTSAPSGCTVDDITYNHGDSISRTCETCTCENGVVNCPCRVRKRVRDLSDTEWNTFAQCLNTVKNSGDYDDWTREHVSFFGVAHGNARFLPWHRAYLLQLEDALRECDCSVTIPYWEWTQDAMAPALSPIWQRFGTTQSGCITTGPAAGWRMPGGSSCVTRGMVIGINFRTAPDIAGLNNVDGFFEFSDVLEAWHAMPHNFVGGAMRTGLSPSDPIFYAHHAFVDKIWADWQAADPSNEFDYSGDVNENMSPFQNIAPADMLRPESRSVCYQEGSEAKRDDSNTGTSHKSWLEILRTLTAEELSEIPRVAPRTSVTDSEEMVALMNWNASQIARIKWIERRYSTAPKFEYLQGFDIGKAGKMVSKHQHEAEGAAAGGHSKRKVGTTEQRIRGEQKFVETEATKETENDITTIVITAAVGLSITINIVTISAYVLKLIQRPGAEE